MKIYTTPLTARAIAKTAEIISRLPRDIDKKIYVFCESKATLSFEKQITKVTGGTFNVDVTSFSRYVSKNAVVTGYVSKTQASLLVRKLMKENRGKLIKLNPDLFSTPKEVYGLISQLKSAMVKPCDLQKIAEVENGVLAMKLKDIVVIYSAYEDYLEKNNLTDENGYLSLMPNLIGKDENLKGASVIVSAIQSYTKQTLEILRALGKVSNLDFVCVSGNYSAFTNESVNKISELFKNAEVIPLDEKDESERFKIAEGLFNPSVFARKGSFTDKIEIYEAKNLKEECEFIASMIRYEVVKNKRRYKDFSVICQDVNSYAPYLKESFYLYDIPLYQDVEQSLDKHPVIGLIGGLIDVKRFNLLPKKAITLSKCGLFCGFEESRVFSKYIYDNAVYRKQMSQPFDDLIAESVRKRITDSVALLNKKDTVKGYVSAIKKILADLDVASRCEKFSTDLCGYGEGVTAEFNDGAISALPLFLDEVSEIMGDITVSLNEFKNIIISGSASVKVSTVPEYNDTVYLGDYRGGRLRESAVTFMPGLTFDVPKYTDDTALLNDRDLIKMDGYKLIVEPKLQIVNERERENITVSAMSFTDKLYLSYPLTDKGGKPALQSEIIKQISAIFSEEDRKMEASAIDKNALSERFPAFYYSSYKAGKLFAIKGIEEYKERLNDDLSDLSAFAVASGEDGIISEISNADESEIFNGDLKYGGNFSPTTIENYFSCPYKAFARNVLKLKETETGETKVYELGNLLHSVMENFINRYTEVTSEEKSESLARILFSEQLKVPLYARYLNKPQYKTIFLHLENEAVKECKRIYKDLSKSDFKPFGTEVEFNESSKNGLKPIYLKLPDKNIPLRGKIDRVDTFCDGENKYFRIIDYKTGSAENSDADFYSGNKIQLYLYMNVFTRLGYKPAGAHYFKLSDDYSTENLDGGEYLGKSLQNKEVLSKLDNDLLVADKSKNLNVKLNTNGTIKETKSVLSEADFYTYIKYAKKVAESGAEEMTKGCFIPSPTEKACEYCAYKGMCGYDAETGENNRDTSKGNKNSILNGGEDDE